MVTHDVLIEDSQILLTRDADQLCGEFERTFEISTGNVRMGMEMEKDQPAPDATYIVPTPVVKSRKACESDTMTFLENENETSLSNGSDQVRRKLNETNEKLLEMESKIKARRISANFSQILAEAKLNRSMTSSPSNLFSEVYADSPKRQVVKQARISNSGSKSFAISTVIEKTIRWRSLSVLSAPFCSS